jgi:L-rhamnose mutarotase
LEEYKKHHQNVWPEMLEALRQAGRHSYSIFVREDGLLFGYFETEQSLQAAQAKMAAKEVIRTGRYSWPLILTRRITPARMRCS